MPKNVKLAQVFQAYLSLFLLHMIGVNITNKNENTVVYKKVLQDKLVIQEVGSFGATGSLDRFYINQH